MTIFVELTAVLIVAAVFAVIMRLFKQPLVVGYILAGILAGPYFLNILQSHEAFEVFSKVGIAILLFIVGVHLSPEVIKEVGKVSLIAGTGQVLFTSAIGYAIARALGFATTPSIYIAIALTFSSTIIILKLLSDRGDLHKLYGKISIGFLLIQDIIATLILVVVSAISASAGEGVAGTLLLLMGKLLVVCFALYLLVRFVLPRFGNFFASSQELLFLSTLAWGLSIATVFYLIGFSIEIGALLAGVLMSIAPFAYEMSSRLKPLRDFFLVLFFVFLGSQMVIESIGALMVPAIILSLFVLIGNPLIVFILMTLLGYRKRPSFFAGLTVAQISEFSLILAGLGLSVGHINQEVVSIITLVGLFTIAGSTYFILYAHKIYPYLENYLRFFDWRSKKKTEKRRKDKAAEVVIFGHGRMGSEIARGVKRLEKELLVVDFNPKEVANLNQQGIKNRYGDMEDVEFLAELGLDEANIVISTIPSKEANLLLLRYVKELDKKIFVVLVADTLAQAKHLYEKGADYVLIPHAISAKYGRHIVRQFHKDSSELSALKEKHIKNIEARLEKAIN
ncbi:MAG: cation:proton antiporter [Candidatus Paceibacterota bacterium]